MLQSFWENGKCTWKMESTWKELILCDKEQGINERYGATVHAKRKCSFLSDHPLVCHFPRNEALQHLVQGKRHLLVRDINSAVNSLQEACRLLAEQYGETADPCGEAYFFYGKALLELSRIETGVLGNALDGGTRLGKELVVVWGRDDVINSSGRCAVIWGNWRYRCLH